jgi:hypothetical protein
METDLSATLPGDQCAVHHAHRPTPLRTVVHHIWPQEYGGPTVPENLVKVCDTGHYNIHALLAQLMDGKEMTGGDGLERAHAALGFDRIKRHAL